MVAAQFETSGATTQMTTQANPSTSATQTVVGGPGSRRIQLPMARSGDQLRSTAAATTSSQQGRTAAQVTTEPLHKPVETAEELQQFVRAVFTRDFAARLYNDFTTSKERQLSWQRFLEYPSASLHKTHYLSEPPQLISQNAHRPAESSSSNPANALIDSANAHQSKPTIKTDDKRHCLFQCLLGCHWTSLCPDHDKLVLNSRRALVGTLAPNPRGKRPPTKHSHPRPVWLAILTLSNCRAQALTLLHLLTIPLSLLMQSTNP